MILGTFQGQWEERPLALSCLTVRQSDLMEEFGFHKTNFLEILYWEFLVKPVHVFQVYFKYDKNKRFYLKCT
jgi:hypothetical protein